MIYNDSDLFIDSLPALKSIPSLIMVAGVGGAGSNAVDHMWQMGIKGVNMVVFNTDAQALDKSPVSRKVLLGSDGLGAGNNAEEGAKKAKESCEDIRNTFTALGTKMLFITAGMGGGTGTGAAPVIAQIAQELGILTVAIVTVVESNEGDIRLEQAHRGINEISKYVDSLIEINNEAISKLYGKMSIQQGYDKANDIVALAAKGIAEIITTKSDLVNVDFADVCKVLRKSGMAVMGVSEASGEDRVTKALESCLRSPLFGGASITGAKNVLINFAYSTEHPLTIEEKNAALELVQDNASVKDDEGHVTRTNIIWGTSVKQDLKDKIEVIIIVTGFSRSVLSTGEVSATPATTAVTPAAPKPTPKPNTIQLKKPENRYTDINELLSRPAYMRRGATLLSATGRHKVMEKEEEEENEVTPQEPTTQDLF